MRIRNANSRSTRGWVSPTTMFADHEDSLERPLRLTGV
jgi:hypothetical protein